jgi:hypothetical protein
MHYKLIEKCYVKMQFLERTLTLVQLTLFFVLSSIASYHYYFLAEIHLYQGYFNISCH